MIASGAKSRRSVGSAILGAVVAGLGIAILQAGLRVMAKWDAISAAYAGVGVVWVAAGAAMIGAGIWTLLSIGRHRIALWITSAASAVAGLVLVCGVLSYIVPCSGPS